MSLNREMLQIARLAQKTLGEATELVSQFLKSLANADGGYADRHGRSDLYYTTFAVSGLMAIQEPLVEQSLSRYIAGFKNGDDLDLVHLSCLVRLHSLLPSAHRPPLDLDRIQKFAESLRTPDGGYNAIPEAKHGTLYGCFLTVGLYQDAGLPLPDPDGVLNCIRSLKTPCGGYGNSLDFPIGLTPVSAAAAALYRQLGAPADPELAEWLLLRLHPDGGFRAAPETPMPDLLSTATALHALSTMPVDLAPLKEPCLDFIDTLWTARGGFYGTWEDDHLDSEYTYYGLLALGHLSV